LRSTTATAPATTGGHERMTKKKDKAISTEFLTKYLQGSKSQVAEGKPWGNVAGLKSLTKAKSNWELLRFLSLNEQIAGGPNQVEGIAELSRLVGGIDKLDRLFLTVREMGLQSFADLIAKNLFPICLKCDAAISLQFDVEEYDKFSCEHGELLEVNG
jgi:hypothetical protein